MSTILVSDHCDGRDLAIRNHPVLIVGLFQESVHPFERPLAHTCRLTEPDRCSRQQDIGFEHFYTDRRPSVSLAFIRRHARLDVVVSQPDRFGFNAVLLEFLSSRQQGRSWEI